MGKTIIFYGSYGGGHLSAARSLKEYMEKHLDNEQVEIIDGVEYVAPRSNKVTIASYNFLSRNAKWLWKFVYDASNKGVLDGFVYWDLIKYKHKFLELIKQKKPDHIICTHPFLSIIGTALVKEGKVDLEISNIITDFEIHRQWYINPEYLKYIFVSTDQMKEDLIKNHVDADKIVVSTIPVRPEFYNILTNEEKVQFKKENNLPQDKKIVTFFAGGAMGLSNKKTLKILQTAVEVLKDYHIICISGKNEYLYNKYVEEFKEYPNISFIRFSNEVSKLMQISEFIFSKPGGLTTSEALATSTPMIIIDPIPGQEHANQRFLENLGSAVAVTKDNAYEVLSSLTDEKVAKMKEAARSHKKVVAAKVIVDTIYGKQDKS